MAKRTRYTPEFRAAVVLEALSGESSQAELCRQHNLSEQQLSKWKQQFLENAATRFESGDKGSQDAAARIAHLEQLVGKLTVALDIHKKAKAWLRENADMNAQGRKVHLNNAEAIIDAGAPHRTFYHTGCITTNAHIRR